MRASWPAVAATTIVIAISASIALGAEPDLLQVIPKLLAKNRNLEHHGFSAKLLKSGWHVSYCPDNTCDVIRAPKDMSRAALGDFTLLWLYYASGYIYLQRFVETDAPPYVQQVLERRSGSCLREPELTLASCVLSTMAASNKLRLSFRRSDEGATVETRKSISDSLSEARIGEVRAWQTNTWQK
jgi:hypothetical protein